MERNSRLYRIVIISEVMEVLSLQRAVVYGPILSRRLGLSLGVNILSPFRKICTFDCIYCHYGKTGMHTKAPPSSAFFSTEEILNAIEIALQSCRRMDYLTFSGNGEPTLHPEFPEIVKEVLILRKKIRPEVKIAVFSNASILEKESVRESFRMIDLPILKMDAGDEVTFQKIDRPSNHIHFEPIVAILASMDHVVLQSMFIDGDVSNCRGKPYENFIKVLNRIKPRSMQIYTTDRQIPEFNVEKLVPQRLLAIAENIKIQTGTDTMAYWS
jgi:wyosine [tRNA(Phe)-imidazoG37] synthetase (radical SAM superfamily)